MRFDNLSTNTFHGIQAKELQHQNSTSNKSQEILKKRKVSNSSKLTSDIAEGSKLFATRSKPFSHDLSLRDLETIYQWIGTVYQIRKVSLDNKVQVWFSNKLDVKSLDLKAVKQAFEFWIEPNLKL